MIGERIKVHNGAEIIDAEIIEDAFEFESNIQMGTLIRTLAVVDDGDLLILYKSNGAWFSSVYNAMEF